MFFRSKRKYLRFRWRFLFTVSPLCLPCSQLVLLIGYTSTSLLIDEWIIEWFAQWIGLNWGRVAQYSDLTLSAESNGFQWPDSSTRPWIQYAPWQLLASCYNIPCGFSALSWDLDDMISLEIADKLVLGTSLWKKLLGNSQLSSAAGYLCPESCRVWRKLCFLWFLHLDKITQMNTFFFHPTKRF